MFRKPRYRIIAIERMASLRFTLLAPAAAVLEEDRVLADLAARLVAAEQHLLLERVAARPDPLEIRASRSLLTR